MPAPKLTRGKTSLRSTLTGSTRASASTSGWLETRSASFVRSPLERACAIDCFASCILAALARRDSAVPRRFEPEAARVSRSEPGRLARAEETPSMSERALSTFARTLSSEPDSASRRGRIPVS